MFWKIVIFGDKSAAVTGGVTTIIEVTELQFVGLLTSHILKVRLQVPAAVFGAIVTVPFAFKINPDSITSPGVVPITRSVRFKLSFEANEDVVPPVKPFTAAVVSANACIVCAEITITEVTELQFVVLVTSHIYM